jgi:hypothetical protein
MAMNELLYLNDFVSAHNFREGLSVTHSLPTTWSLFAADKQVFTK